MFMTDHVHDRPVHYRPVHYRPVHYRPVHYRPVHDRPVHDRPHSQKATFTKGHIHNRPHSLQTRSLQTTFMTDAHITDHIHHIPIHYRVVLKTSVHSRPHS